MIFPPYNLFTTIQHRLLYVSLTECLLAVQLFFWHEEQGGLCLLTAQLNNFLPLHEVRQWHLPAILMGIDFSLLS